MKGRPIRTTDFLVVSFVGTLFFDTATGIIPTLIHGKTMLESLILQGPFTIRHLSGNAFFALLAPSFYKWVMANPRLEIAFTFRGAKA